MSEPPVAGRRATPDAVDLAVFAARVRGIAWQVGSTVHRSARSTLMQQGDLAAGVLDRQGQVIALDEHLPLLAYSLAPGARSILEAFGPDIGPGDVFLHNDVWHGNIQHADTGVFVPAFHDGELVAWVACRGHWADIGGAVAGTANPHATEVWQEALRIPPVRVIRGGQWCRDVWSLIFANVRLRALVESDARAQVGACQLGAMAVAALVIRLGGGKDFDTLAEALFQATGRVVDAALRGLPPGRYLGESVYVDDAPAGVTEYPIRVAVEAGGPRLVVDFTGSAPQTPTMMNAPLGSTTAAALVTLLTLLGPEVDHNEGVLSRFDVRAPVGCMLNARFPAATFGGNKLCEYVGSAILAALTGVLPDRVSAEWSRRLSLRVSGLDPRHERPFHEILFLTYGGGGAVQGADGYNQPGLMSGGNVVHQDYESLELQAPLVVWRHEYAPDTAGRGRWRGGLGNETVIELYGRDLVLVTHGGGTTSGAKGVLGGEAGAPNLLEVRDAQGVTRRVHAREKVGPLAPPVLVRQLTGGGGGYGPPERRDPAAQARDVAEGVVAGSETT